MKAPRGRFQSIADGVDRQRTGAARRVANASPVSAHSSAVAEAVASAAIATYSESMIDLFTLASDGAQDLALTYLPKFDSWNVSISGVTLTDSSGYTVSGQTLSLLTAADARTGETVQVQYDYLAGQSQTALGEVRDSTSSIGVNSSPVLPAGSTAGDFCVMFVGLDVSRSITALNGYTDHGTVSITHMASSVSATYVLHTLTKTITGSTDVPTLPTGVPQPVWACAVFSGGGSLVDYDTATTADGTSGPSPALSSGVVAVRCWLNISPGTALTPPARGDLHGVTDNLDIDACITVETDMSTVSATSSGNAGWAMSAVGVNP